MGAPMIALGLIGSRRGEMAGLRWSSIDLEHCTMKVVENPRIVLRGKVIDNSMGTEFPRSVVSTLP